MNIDVVELASELIAMPSETPTSNRPISDFLRGVLEEGGFSVEEVPYIDPSGEEKVSLVAKRGEGAGGLGLFSHSDTVPGDAGWEPFTPALEDGRLVGRGSADMKGPLAASIAAACRFNDDELKQPLVIVVTADEEHGHVGAHDIVIRSQNIDKRMAAILHRLRTDRAAAGLRAQGRRRHHRPRRAGSPRIPAPTEANRPISKSPPFSPK